MFTSLFNTLLRPFLSSPLIISVQRRFMSNSDFWRIVAQKDVGQETDNPYILSSRIIKRGGKVTLHDLNSVLKKTGNNATDTEFQTLTQLPYTTHKLPLSESEKKSLKDILNAVVYLFVENATGFLYVGSSIKMHERYRTYQKEVNKNFHGARVRTIVEILRTKGFENFTLRIYILPDHFSSGKYALILEQYYLLALNPRYNDLLVAGWSPGGLLTQDLLKNAVYMYHGNTLLYVFSSTRSGPDSFTNGLMVSKDTLAKVLQPGNLLWDTYLITKTPLDPMQTTGIINLEQLLKSTAEARALSKRTFQQSPPVIVTFIENCCTPITTRYNSFGSAMASLTAKGVPGITYKSIGDYMNTGKRLHGYLFTSVKD